MRDALQKFTSTYIEKWLPVLPLITPGRRGHWNHPPAPVVRYDMALSLRVWRSSHLRNWRFLLSVAGLHGHRRADWRGGKVFSDSKAVAFFKGTGTHDPGFLGTTSSATYSLDYDSGIQHRCYARSSSSKTQLQVLLSR